MSKRVFINNVEQATDANTVQQLADALQLPERGVALAVNNAVVPRAAWGDTPVTDGDNVTIIKAFYGG